MRAAAGPRRGAWIPWIFVAFFVVVVAANGIMVWLGAETWTGLMRGDTYRKGIAYNDTLAIARAQAALGWRLDVELTPAADGRLRVALEIADRDGRGLAGAEVGGTFFRPTHGGYDTEIAFVGQGGGRYAGTVALPLAGQWDLRLAIRLGTQRYRATRRVVVP